MAKRYVGGASKLRRQLKKLEPELRAELKATMGIVGADIAADLKANAPVDEGFLRNAAHYKVSSDGLGVNIGYSQYKPGFKRLWNKGRGFEALYAEFGTKHHAAQPFIRKSFRAGVKRALDSIDTAVSRTIRGALRK